MTPTISIAVPCYNSERFIRTVIESALAQSVPCFELLLSDDNSTDRSFEIISDYKHLPNVRIIRPAQRLALGDHYRFLLEHARSDYVCFLSADDALMPGFVEKMQKVVEHDPSLGMVSAGCLECDSSLKPIRVRGLSYLRHPLNPPEGFRHFATGCTYTISTAIFSRQLLLETKALPAGATIPIDWYWALQIGLRAKIGFLREPLGYYRFHDANASHSATERWRQEARRMLQFVLQENHLDAANKLQLEQTLRNLTLEPMAASPVDFFVALKRSFKDLAKRFLALQYRSLPQAILMAEHGRRVQDSQSSSRSLPAPSLT